MGCLTLVPQPSGITVAFDGVAWKFNKKTDGRKHFWSTDDSECLWCGRRRTRAEIDQWREAGMPVEYCR